MGKVAWEALLTQAQTSRDLAQALCDLTHANRVTVDAMLLAMPVEHDCIEPPGRVELRAWFHDAHGVAAVSEAIELECRGGRGAKACVGTKRTPSVLEMLRRGGNKEDPLHLDDQRAGLSTVFGNTGACCSGGVPGDVEVGGTVVGSQGGGGECSETEVGNAFGGTKQEPCNNVQVRRIIPATIYNV